MRSRSGTGALALASMMVVCAVSACGSSGGKASSSDSAGTSGATTSKKAIKVLALVDTTGPLALYGKQELAGIKAGAAYYNAHGGMDGHKVTVTSVTTNGDPSTAVTALVKELGSNPGKYTMVYPGEASGTSGALIPVLAKYKTIAIADVDGVGTPCQNASKCPYTFAISGGKPAPAIQAAARFFKGKGVTKVGILTDAQAFGKTELPVAKAEFGKAGFQYADAEYPGTATDVTTQMNKLKGEGAKAVFVEGLGTQPALALLARKRLNWNVPVMFDPAASAIDLTKLVPAGAANNAYLDAAKCQDSSAPSPGIAQLKKYVEPSAIGPIPCIIIGTGWDSMVNLNTAISQSHSIDADAMRKALENMTPANQKNPLYISTDGQKFSASYHDNLALTIDSQAIIPVSPVTAWQNRVSKP